ncbi:hypothetical protein CkaCkLH20_11790 [Colletotrichum karsti]|uniref:N-acetyltransferase ESCO zinc-finger domain-containing protein n=1 Tax=Colletotrichum karsti TaxID=1095194 RepID=A0A9P6LER2_9PEZI|nr:uncharacterized protein CkaCkLH20_11790 [Colletotrichum karsti]KAF9870688.1 hypothetical protein CkaCkLH20_11790 [Colletotrichum karsti]
MISTKGAALSPTVPRDPRPAPEKRRTLRTYSKRSRSAEDDTTTRLVKKQRVIIEETPVPRPEPSRLPPPPPPPPSHANNIPKSSILSYFKPCRSSSATEPSDPLSDSEKLVKTPPSSPPVVRRIREPRRLRLRPSTAILPSDVDNGRCEDDEEQSDEQKPGRKTTRSGRRDDKELQEAAKSRLNEGTDKTLAKSSSKPNLRSKPATIQTTINISSKPTFEECKICRMVYNPLHPPDVKYHTQTHAAYLRSRAKK